jgi:hypothetical protein
LVSVAIVLLGVLRRSTFQQAAGDDMRLDFGGALEDRQDARVA